MYNSSTPICLLCIKDRVSEDNSQKLAYVTCGHTFHEKWYVTNKAYRHVCSIII